MIRSVVGKLFRSTVLTKNPGIMSANTADFMRKNQEAAALLKAREFEVSLLILSIKTNRHNQNVLPGSTNCERTCY